MLETKKASTPKRTRPHSSSSQLVDLSGEAFKSMNEVNAEQSPVPAYLSDWFRRIHLSGFGAAGFIGTGQDAERSDLGFLNYDASLFIEADVWEDVSFFTELQTVRFGDDAAGLRTGEVYIDLKKLLKRWDEDLLNVRLGRVDIPFGREYLWQDSIDDPLITRSVNWANGFDEGLVLYGKWGGLGWIASVMDGRSTRSIEDNDDKSISLKFFGQPVDALDLSASFFRSGSTERSALGFAGATFEPVGRGDGVATSALGTSPSTEVEAYAYSLDAEYRWENRGHLRLTFGQGFLEDNNSVFDPDWLFFTVEPLIQLNDSWYLVTRFSGIGTFENNKGYHFRGRPFANGTADFGDDAKSLLRFAVGLGYRPNPRTLVKLEYSRDDFEVIDSSTLNDSDEDRDLFGIQVAVRF